MKLISLIVVAAVLAFFIGSASAANMAQVQIKNYQFQPAQVTIQKGDTVTWTNMDPVTHDVDIQGSTSPDLKKGDTYSKTFDKAGMFDYICSIHPSMKGKVIVK
jgi:amicyanin